MILAPINRVNLPAVVLIIIWSQHLLNCSYANESGEPPNFLVFVADDLNKEYYLSLIHI